MTYRADDVIAGQASPVASTPIGGLSNGQTYYVIAVDKDHIQLSARPPLALDPSATNTAAIQTLSIPNRLISYLAA